MIPPFAASGSSQELGPEAAQGGTSGQSPVSGSSMAYSLVNFRWFQTFSTITL
jgi:hypothetical protein